LYKLVPCRLMSRIHTKLHPSPYALSLRAASIILCIVDTHDRGRGAATFLACLERSSPQPTKATFPLTFHHPSMTRCLPFQKIHIVYLPSHIPYLAPHPPVAYISPQTPRPSLPCLYLSTVSSWPSGKDGLLLVSVLIGLVSDRLPRGVVLCV
jgi:hypothetical protein